MEKSSISNMKLEINIEFPLHYNCAPIAATSLVEHQIVDANQRWLIGREELRDTDSDRRRAEIFKTIIEMANKGYQAEERKCKFMIAKKCKECRLFQQDKCGGIQAEAADSAERPCADFEQAAQEDR